VNLVHSVDKIYLLKKLKNILSSLWTRIHFKRINVTSSFTGVSKGWHAISAPFDARRLLSAVWSCEVEILASFYSHIMQLRAVDVW
jgi:hypothetical protein